MPYINVITTNYVSAAQFVPSDIRDLLCIRLYTHTRIVMYAISIPLGTVCFDNFVSYESVDTMEVTDRNFLPAADV